MPESYTGTPSAADQHVNSPGARLNTIIGRVHVVKFNLTRILLKRAFSFGGKVTVGIVAVEIRIPSTSAHVAKVSPDSQD